MTEETVGHADFVLGADIGGVKKGVDEAEKLITASGTDAEKKYADSGKRAGTAFSKALALGVKALTGATSAGFAIATKGLLELDTVQAKYTADTGATADEAARAGKAINAMAGRNIQGMSEIGDALAKVHTDLGLTGDAAEKVTERFLKFGRATGQEASAAVLAFDDILDGWGLTATDAAGIMDKLIASHQRFGGSIAETQGALSALAPAMKAANLQIDDGIGLLNLFAASGLDATQAPAALTKALANVKSPAELQRLIADISATEDPFKRAALASDLFGAKAGPKLANALAGANLGDFKISMEQAAGATEKAAAAMDSSIPARFQLALKAAGSVLTEFGSAFGPVLTAGASLGTMIATLAPGFLSLATAQGIAAAAATGLRVAMTLALGPIGLTIAAIGAVAIALHQAAEDSKHPAQLLARIIEEGTAPPGVIRDAKARLEELRAAYRTAVADLAAIWESSTIARAATNVGTAAVAGVTAGLKSGRFVVRGGALVLADEIEGGIAKGKAQATAVALKTPGAVADAIRKGQADVASGMDALRKAMKHPMDVAKEEARLRGLLVGKTLQAGLHSSNPLVRAQAEATAALITGQLAELEGAAKRYGRGTGKSYAAGLQSTTGLVSSAAAALAWKVKDQLAASSPPGPKSLLHEIDHWGARTAAAYASGLLRGIPDVAAASAALAASVGLRPALSGFGGGEAALAAMTVSSRASGGGITRIVHSGTVRFDVTPASADAFRRAGFDEREVARHLVDASVLANDLRQRREISPNGLSDSTTRGRG